MWTPGEDSNNKPAEVYDDLSDLEVIEVDFNKPISTKPGQKRFVYVEEDGFWNESATEWKNAYATWIIVGVLVLAFIFQGIFGEEAVINAGSVNWPTVFGKFQIWRLFTCILLHSNWEHLISNLIVLIVCGVLLEKRVARKRLMVTFLAGGLFASLCSAVFNHVLPMQVTFRTFFGDFTQEYKDIPSIGASGAIAALLSATLLYLLLFSKPLDGYVEGRASKGTLGGLFIFYILFNATGGIFTKQAFVDTAAHLGGFIAGIVVMLIYGMLDLQKQKWDD